MERTRQPAAAARVASHRAAGPHLRADRRLAPALIAAAGLAAYAGSFSGAFVLDDPVSILDNSTIRHLGNLGAVLAPLHGHGLTVDGRPVLNLSFALNWAVSGPRVWSYHALNLAIHILAGLALFGILRRTLRHGIAFAVALLWVVHPLNTAAVTYVSQRAESLMGLFYLLTVYCFIRYMEHDSVGHVAASDSANDRSGTLQRFDRALWASLSILSCFAGMATKEVMVSAPLTVLLLDRLALAGSFAQAWRRRRGYYFALAASWLLLAGLVLAAGSRGGTSGAGAGVPLARYWATQPSAIAHYLRLAFWPHPLVFDYGVPGLDRPVPLLAPLLLVAALAGGAAWGLARNRAWGLLAFVFFAVLAPTSLVPGNRQTVAEHRMYLALIPVLIWALLVVERVDLNALGRPWGRSNASRSKRSTQDGFLLAIFALVLGGLTYARTLDYRSALRLYGGDAVRQPDNAYAQANYGNALLLAGRYGEAAGRLEQALRVHPGLAVAENDLGDAYLHLGRDAEAETRYVRAIAADPGMAMAHENLATLRLRQRRAAEARPEIDAALRLSPDSAGAHSDLGLALVQEGRLPEAVAAFRDAVSLDPADPAVRQNLATALLAEGRRDDAIAQFRTALRLDPAREPVRRTLRALGAAESGE